MKKEYTDTQIKIKLGKHEYVLKFGVLTRRRIEEKQPGFNLFSQSLPEFEVLPLLVESAIKVEDRKWESEEEFLDLVDDLPMDTKQKIVLSFQNSVGFTSQTFLPIMEKVQGLIQQAEEERIKEMAKRVE